MHVEAGGVKEPGGGDAEDGSSDDDEPERSGQLCGDTVQTGAAAFGEIVEGAIGLGCDDLLPFGGWLEGHKVSLKVAQGAAGVVGDDASLLHGPAYIDDLPGIET